MTRLEEIDVLVEGLDKKAKEAWEPLNAKCKEINEHVENRVKLAVGALTSEAQVKFNMNSWGEGSGSVELVDAEGNRHFGSGFDMYFSKHYDDKQYHFSVNCGTTGSFTKESTIEITRYKMLVAVINIMSEIETYLISVQEELKPLNTAYYDIDCAREKLEREKRDIIEAQKRTASDESVEVGKYYINKNHNAWKRSANKIFKGYKAAKVVEIQNKRVLLEVGYVSEWNPATKAYDNNYKEFVSQDTYLMNKEDFYKGVYYGSIVETAFNGDRQY